MSKTELCLVLGNFVLVYLMSKIAMSFQNIPTKGFLKVDESKLVFLAALIFDIVLAINHLSKSMTSQKMCSLM